MLDPPILTTVSLGSNARTMGWSVARSSWRLCSDSAASRDTRCRAPEISPGLSHRR